MLGKIHHMYPDSNLPKPLHATEFYILLALAGGESHAYPLKGRISNQSLGSVNLNDAQLYRFLDKLCGEAFIEPTGPQPAGKSGKPRLHYGITPHGSLRLEAEIQRFTHAVAIAQNIGFTKSEVPREIQRLLLDLKNERAR